MPHEEWPDIERMLKEQGWTVGPTGGGHIRALPPDKSQKPVFLSATPSDWRAMRNNLRDLKKSGFRYPPDAPADEPAEPLDDEPASDSEPLGDWEQLFPTGLIYEGPIDDVAIAIEVLVGRQISRIDRVDPRDPKAIVAIDVDGKRIIFRDRHQRKVTQDIREFSRDIRKSNVRFLEPDEAAAQQLPDVGGMRFCDALLALRQASGLSPEELAQTIGDSQMSVRQGAIESWESERLAPTRKAYQALCTLWPGLRQAYPPKEELGDTLPLNAMTNNDKDIWTGGAIEALDEAVRTLEVCQNPLIGMRRNGPRWYVWVKEEKTATNGEPPVAIGGEGNSVHDAIADIFRKLQRNVAEHEAKLREREKQLAKQRSALQRFGGGLP